MANRIKSFLGNLAFAVFVLTVGFTMDRCLSQWALRRNVRRNVAEKLATPPDAEWVGPRLYITKGERYWFVCRQSGKQIAEVSNANPGIDEWTVWGGNGRAYGYYLTLEQAKRKAESLSVDPVFTSVTLLHCP